MAHFKLSGKQVQLGSATNDARSKRFHAGSKFNTVSNLTLLVWQQEQHPDCK